jgi:hypothetical protein
MCRHQGSSFLRTDDAFVHAVITISIYFGNPIYYKTVPAIGKRTWKKQSLPLFPFSMPIGSKSRLLYRKHRRKQLAFHPGMCESPPAKQEASYLPITTNQMIQMFHLFLDNSSSTG